MTVRDLFVRFGADTSGFSAGTQQVKRELDGLNTRFFDNKKKLQEANKEYNEAKKALSALAKEIKDSGSATAAQKTAMADLSSRVDQAALKVGQLRTTEQELKAQIKTANGELQQQTNQMKGVSTGADSASRSIGQMATAVKALILGYTGKKLYEVLIGSNAEMEQYLTGFDVLLGSAEKAESMMNQLTSTFAGKMGIDSVVKNTEMLIGYGVAAEDVVGILYKLGDASKGNASILDRVSLAYGQMVSKGQVMTQDLRQMTEAGVPILQALADAAGVTTGEMQDMITAGEVGIPELNKALEGLTTGAGQFAGMMEKRSQDFKGMLALLTEDFKQFGRDAGEQGFQTVRTALAELMQDVQAAKESGDLDKIAKNMGKSIGSLVTTLISAVKIMWEFREVLVAGAAAIATYKTITTVVSALEAFKKAQNAATVSQAAFNAVANANPYVLLASALAAAVAAMVVYVSTTPRAASATEELQEKISETTAAVAETTAELERLDERLADLQSGGLGGTIEGMDELLYVSDTLIPKIEELGNKTDEYGNKTERTSGENDLLKQYIERVNEVLGYEAYALDVSTGALVRNTAEIYNNIEALKLQLKQKSIIQDMEDTTKAMRNAEKNIGQAQEDFDAAHDNFNPLIAMIPGVRTSYTKPLADAQRNLEDEQKNLQNARDNMEQLEKELEELSKEASKFAEKTGEAASNAGAGAVQNSAKELEQMKLMHQAGYATTEEYTTQLKSQMAQAQSEIDSLVNVANPTKEQQTALNDALKQYNQYQSELESITKKAASSSKAAKTKTEAQADEFKILKAQRESDLISVEEYYTALLKMAKEARAEVAKLEAIESPTAKQRIALQEALEEYKTYYAELEKLRKEDASNVKTWVSGQSKAYKELYDYQKKLLDKQYDEQLARIEEEMDAEEKRINALIDNIDKEIQARQRLKESENSDKQIEAVQARLKYDQLDEFTRQELERQLARLREEKAETEWQNAMADKKASLQSELADAKEEAAARKQRLKEHKEEMEEMLAAEKENIEEIFEYISNNFDSLAELEQAGIQDINDIFLLAAATEKREVENTFATIKDGTLSVADLYATTISKKIGEVFDYQVARAVAALQELENAISSAKSAARSLKSSSSSSSTVNTTNASININNPFLSSSQIANKVVSTLVDPIF